MGSLSWLTRCCSLAAAALMLGCNSGGGDGGSPTDPGGNIALALTATPATIPLNGHAQVVAQVTATGGAARGGLRVVLATNLGTLDSTQLTTDANGRAETTLRAGATSGTARITGTLEGRSTAATEVRIGLDRVVTLQIEPSTITGNQTATVTVFAFEGDGAPVPPGTDVELSTDRGQLGAVRLDTDVLGAAVTTLRTGGATGTAHVTARVAGGPTATAQATLLAAPPSGTTLRLTASPPSTPANGTTTITVLVADAAGAPLSGAEVQLGTTIGRLDLTRLHTDTSGLATTTLRGDGRRGTATPAPTSPAPRSPSASRCVSPERPSRPARLPALLGQRPRPHAPPGGVDTSRPRRVGARPGLRRCQRAPHLRRPGAALGGHRALDVRRERLRPPQLLPRPRRVARQRHRGPARLPRPHARRGDGGARRAHSRAARGALRDARGRHVAGLEMATLDGRARGPPPRPALHLPRAAGSADAAAVWPHRGRGEGAQQAARHYGLRNWSTVSPMSPEMRRRRTGEISRPGWTGTVVPRPSAWRNCLCEPSAGPPKSRAAEAA